MLSICQWIVHSPSQNWDLGKPAVLLEECTGSQEQSPDPQLARGIPHTMECHGALRYWASLTFPPVFLCVSPFHHNYYSIFTCFNYKTAFSPLWRSVFQTSTDQRIFLSAALLSPLASPCHPCRIFFTSTKESTEPFNSSFSCVSGI